MTSSVIEEAEAAEIKATILEKLADKSFSVSGALRLYSKWLRGDRVHEIGSIGLTASFNMAWQKRGSGNRYDSISIHAIMIGARTKK